MSAESFKLKVQEYLSLNNLRLHDSLGPSGLGAPADGQRRIVPPTVLCVGGVPKQNKMAIEAEIENKFVYLNSKCCRVPLHSADSSRAVPSRGGGAGGQLLPPEIRHSEYNALISAISPPQK